MPTALERLIRKETSLGLIREQETREDFIGNTIAPMKDVDSDEVTFAYLEDTGATGLAPARADDAESKLYQRDDFRAGEGRASVIDWALKDKYTASEVERYRQDLLDLEKTGGAGAGQRIGTLQSNTEKFQSMLNRDALERRRRLDNRIEWLQVTPLVTGGLSYNDGDLKWDVDFGRPADQTDQAPTSGLWDFETNPDFDVIGDLLKVAEDHYDKYGIELKRGIISKKKINQWYRSTKFRQLGLFQAGLANPAQTDIDLNYLGGAVTPQAAINYIQEQTGITFETYDAAIRTRPVGQPKSAAQMVRFMPEDRVILMPDSSGLAEFDNTEIGFASTLTSPHPEGNWASGFYEWEQETTDPWMFVRGTGIKAFPVFPYLQYTRTLKV